MKLETMVTSDRRDRNEADSIHGQEDCLDFMRKGLGQCGRVEQAPRRKLADYLRIAQEVWFTGYG